MNKVLLFTLALALGWACTSKTESVSESTNNQASEKNIITAGGTVSEIVDALGFGNQIIATDITSTYPQYLQTLPSIGYRNQIKAEGILALGPDTILAEEGYLSEDVVNQLNGAGIDIRFFKKPTQVEETKTLVTELAAFFEVPEKGTEINAQIDADLQTLADYLASQSESPSAAFVMARGPETVFLAGKSTFSESMFAMAGITPVKTEFEDFVPLTPESLVALNPDFLVLFDSGLKSLGGTDGLSRVQGIRETNAFKNGQIISMDGHYLSAFGPRVGKAALELAQNVRK
jgi:iron complex transport system substrate-binding protein